jgi:hypothetical protein
MKKIGLSILLSITATILLSQNVADGEVNDWKMPLKYYDSEAHIQYNVKNNDSMLFICVRVPDYKFQMKIAKAGMSLFIDTTGKKKQNIVINYPIKPKDPEPVIMNKIRTLGNDGIIKIKQIIEPSLKQFNSKGFIIGNGTYIQKNIEGIITAGNLDSIGILTIEYQIPFKTFYHKLTAVDNHNKITFSIVINSLLMPQWGAGQHESAPLYGDLPSDEPLGNTNIPDPQEMEQMFHSSTSIFKHNLVLR